MKITLSWLKDHLETSASFQEIADRFTKNGLLVESIHNQPLDLKGFVIAEILETHPHPNAERLKIFQVSTGSAPLQIVCGASNARPGLKTVLATPGSLLPHTDITIRQSKIRGVESAGMLCSEKELGLAEQSEGIIELKQNAKIGDIFTPEDSGYDPLFDIEVTPNRGDSLSARGLARDLAATRVGHLKPLEYKPLTAQFPCPIHIKIDHPTGCSLYKGRLIKGVKNGPSPLWLQEKLSSVGLKSISTLVDITNFIAHDLGQPLHVFDADKISGPLTLRAAHENEQFKALDGLTYTLTSDMLVISTQQDLCALAGIMGGLESSCSFETGNVFIEAAVFDPVQVALTGRSLNILSEARFRFERQVDPAGVESALNRAVALILELCGGELSEEVTQGTPTLLRPKIHFTAQMMESLTGLKFSEDQCQNILTGLGFTLVAPHTFQVPSWRPDITTKADLVEEILRIQGYDQLQSCELPKISPLFSTSSASKDLFFKNSYPAQWKIQRTLVAKGFSEIYSWSFIKEKWAEAFQGATSELKINNPISIDMAYMRPNLLPGLLQAFYTNVTRGQQSTALFEIGQYYQKETERLGVAGVRGFTTGPQHWLTSGRTVDIFDAKSDVYTILEGCQVNVSQLLLSSEVPSWYHPGRSGALKLGPKLTLAYFGELHPTLLNLFDLKGRVVAFEVFMDAIPHLLEKKKLSKGCAIFSSYQSVERDFSFIISQEIPAEKLINLIQKVDQTLITAVSIFDVYQGENVPEGHKSLGIRIHLQPQNKTLTEAEITTISQKIIETVQENLKAKLRS